MFQSARAKLADLEIELALLSATNEALQRDGVEQAKLISQLQKEARLKDKTVFNFGFHTTLPFLNSRIRDSGNKDRLVQLFTIPCS